MSRRLRIIHHRRHADAERRADAREAAAVLAAQRGGNGIPESAQQAETKKEKVKK